MEIKFLKVSLGIITILMLLPFFTANTVQSAECVPKAERKTECNAVSEEANKSYICMPEGDANKCAEDYGGTGSSHPTAYPGCSAAMVCCVIPVCEDAPATPQTYTLTNPLGTADLRVIAGKVINTFLGIVGALALLVFVYAGLSYLIAGGNDQMVTKAKATMKYAVIGVFLIMFSYAITDSFVTLWTKDISLSQSTDPSLPAEEDTQAEQEVADILSQQQQAQSQADEAKSQSEADTSKVTDPEAAAKASAKSAKSDVCGTTPATEGHSCMLIKTAEKNDYNCLSGYCQSNSASNYLCCKKKE